MEGATMSEFDQPWRAIQTALEGPPEDLVPAIEALPEVGGLPSPWATWTLFGLVRHRRRQLWVTGIVVGKLGGDPEALAAMGAFGHPTEVPQQGLVPGLTEWEYFFHGKGCRLTHRGTGEAIDVDFFGPDGEFFDLFFYRNYLRSLRAPEPPEALLIALHRSIDPIRLAVGEFLEAGMLCPLEGRDEHPFRIAEHVLDHEDAIDAFCEAWERPAGRPWIAAAVGDWLASREAVPDGGDRGIIGLTSARAEACRAIRCRGLLDGWHDEGRRGDILLALDDLDAEALAEWLGKSLRGPIGGLTSKAVQIIQRRDDPDWCPAIHQLFRRLDPKGSLPQPYLWAECLRFLLRHGDLADEMRGALTRANGVALGDEEALEIRA
jgi:hypothetical protein